MKTIIILLLVTFSSGILSAQIPLIHTDDLPYALYPAVNEHQPALPSPFRNQNKEEFVIAVTNDNRYAIIPVTLSDERAICRQLIVDTLDFPTLVKTGLHSDEQLAKIKTITNRPVEEITALGRPGRLSQGGFMAADEDIVSVLRGDNELVRRLQLTHPELARPLFHVLNMIDEDLALNRWNMARHQWEHIPYFFYNGRKVMVKAEDTKGGQQSIFDDGIGGGFFIQIWRDLTPTERQFLQEKYRHLPMSEFETLVKKLRSFNTGEMQPQYIMRYGFYEGHTYWRTDPLAIAFIFGLKDLEEIEEAFPAKLYEILTGHHYSFR